MKKTLLSISAAAMLSLTAMNANASDNIGIDNKDDQSNISYSFNIFYHPTIEHITTNENENKNTTFQSSSQNDNNIDRLSQLPDEIKLHVLQQLSFKETKIVSRVSKAYKTLANDITILTKGFKKPVYEALTSMLLSGQNSSIIRAIINRNLILEIDPTDEFTDSISRIDNDGNKENYPFQNVGGSFSSRVFKYASENIANPLEYLDIVEKFCNEQEPKINEFFLCEISRDKNIIVGIGRDGQGHSSGIKLLPKNSSIELLPCFEDRSSIAKSINSNGSIIVGATKGDNNNTDSAAIWINNHHFFLKDLIPEAQIPDDFNLKVVDTVSPNGKIIVGTGVIENKIPLIHNSWRLRFL